MSDFTATPPAGRAGFFDPIRETAVKIGYARVSTEDQNLALQLDALRACGCAPVFTDRGVSAVATQRPAFEQALRTLQPGDTLTVWKLDRAFRSLSDALLVLDRLKADTIGFRSLTDQIDTNTAMGRFTYQISNAFAELERELIVERTRAGLAAAKQRGVRLGRPRALQPGQIVAIRRAIAEDGACPQQLAASLGIHPRTLSRALERHYREGTACTHE